MKNTKIGLFALFFLFGAAVLVPVLSTGIASADSGAYVCDNSPAISPCSYDGGLLRCDVCALHDYDRSAVRDSGSSAGEYTCNLCGCGWAR